MDGHVPLLRQRPVLRRHSWEEPFHPVQRAALPAASPTFHQVDPAVPFFTRAGRSPPTKRIQKHDSMLWQRGPEPVIGTAAAPCGNFRVKFPSHFLREAVSSLLILFPSSYFYLVFHLTTQLKQPPVFFLFLQSIRNKQGDIFSPPYTDKNSIALWSRFQMSLTEFQSLP